MVNIIKLTLQKGLQFMAEDEENHKIIVDTEARLGGLEQGIQPMKFILISLGGCMGMDIVSILKKKGGKIDEFKVTVQGERAPEHPKSFTKITVNISCKGDYKREDLLRSFELSRDKFCGATETLRKGTQIEFNI